MNRLFRVFVPAGALALFVCEAILIVFSFLLATFAIMPEDPGVFLLDYGGWIRVSIVTLIIVGSMYFQELYAKIFVKSRVALLQQLCIVMGTAFLAEAFVTYANPDLRMPVRVMVLGSAVCLAGILAWRIVYTTHVLRLVGAERLLFVGAAPPVPQIARSIEDQPLLGLSVIGYIDDPTHAAEAPGRLLGGTHSLMELAAATKPDRIVVGLADRRERMPVGDLVALRFAGFQIEEAWSTYENVFGRVWSPGLRPTHFLVSGEAGLYATNPMLPRLVNLLAGAIGGLICLPLAFFVAATLRLLGRGPIMARQLCIGRGQRIFTRYRFWRPADLENPSGARARFACWVHRKSLDAIPEFWNVLREDMALVGPRPDAVEGAAVLNEQIPYYRQRYRLEPGMTGWAQIRTRAPQTVDEFARALEHDLYYLRCRSLSLDIHILITAVRRWLFRVL